MYLYELGEADVYRGLVEKKIAENAHNILVFPVGP